MMYFWKHRLQKHILHNTLLRYIVIQDNTSTDMNQL